jgi:hypothetical protein
MADYYSPTVIQQLIPIADMTPLERLLLTHLFDAEPDDDALYFFSEDGPSSVLYLPVTELRTALEASAATPSTTTNCIVEQLASAPADATDIEIDLSVDSWEPIFQDIVRRSSTLRYVTALTSFTCSKMRPDAFGGMAVLITPDAVMGKSTNDILEDFLAETQLEPYPIQSHVLLRLDATSVRTEIGHVIETDDTVTALTIDQITDDDIQVACRSVVARANLSEELGTAVFSAALAALREAERRHAPSDRSKSLPVQPARPFAALPHFWRTRQ